MNLKNRETLFLRQTEYFAWYTSILNKYSQKHQDVFGNTVQTSITFVRKNMASSASLQSFFLKVSACLPEL